MLWGQEVGRLSWHEKRNTSFFVYNPEFLKGGLDIAPLVASIRLPQSTRAIYGETERIYQKLPSFIADSLPDAWGNQLFEQWRRESKISERDVTPLEKLAFIGRRGMGALEFVPEIDRGAASEQIDIKALADMAERIVAERENVRIAPDELLTIQSLISVGTSAGGRQPKGIIAINRETGEIRSGQVEHETGYDYYIMKFGDRARSTAELEQAYYEMATEAGISMMESRLMEVDGTRHFLTKRFDRDETGKLHTQTLAAMMPEADSYEKLLMVCRKLGLPEVDCQEVFRRMVFNILGNNTDDHNKNFTFVMNREVKWRLSPAYDMTYIFDIGGFLPNRDHCLMVAGKYRDVTLEDVVSFAKENGIRTPMDIVRNVALAMTHFRTLAEKNGVRDEWTGRVEATISERLEKWGLAESRWRVVEWMIDGHQVTNVRIEQAYKGNYHLMADIDGRERKYVIGKNKEEYGMIEKAGIANLTEEQLRAMVEKWMG